MHCRAFFFAKSLKDNINLNALPLIFFSLDFTLIDLFSISKYYYNSLWFMLKDILVSYGCRVCFRLTKTVFLGYILCNELYIFICGIDLQMITSVLNPSMVS